jgi:hypothetical protein
VQMYLSVRISSMKSLRKLFNFLRSMILWASGVQPMAFTHHESLAQLELVCVVVLPASLRIRLCANLNASWVCVRCCEGEVCAMLRGWGVCAEHPQSVEHPVLLCVRRNFSWSACVYMHVREDACLCVYAWMAVMECVKPLELREHDLCEYVEDTCVRFYMQLSYACRFSYASACVHAGILVYLPVCARAFTCISKHVCKFTCTCVVLNSTETDTKCTRWHIHVCMYVRLCTYVWYIHTYMHTYMSYIYIIHAYIHT